VSGVLVWVGVGVLGGLGAVARVVLDAAVGVRAGRALPVGTFVVNVSGAFGLGLVVGLDAAGDVLLLVGTAALGAYTTFSTWMFETERLGEDGERTAAAVNVIAGLAVGLGAAVLGRVMGGAL
jgi:CrcB protein